MNELISKPLDVSFRGKTSSSEFNTSENERYHDILSLYRFSNEILEKVAETNETIIVENFFQKKAIDHMRNEMLLLKRQVEELKIKKDTGVLERIQESYARAFFTTDEGGAPYSTELEVDSQLAGSFVTAPFTKHVSKTHILREDGSIFIPKDLEIDLYISDNTMQLSHNGFDRIFNGDFSSIWQAKLIDPKAELDSVKEQQLQFDMKLPTSISQQKKINTVTLYPHPIQGMVIENIEIYYNGVWTQIPGFHQVGIINQEGMHEWSFADRYAERVRFTLKQRSVLDVGNQAVYYFGMQHMEIAYRSYSQTPAYVMTRFDLSDEPGYTITGIYHSFLNREAFSVGTHLDDELLGTVYEYKIYGRTVNEDLIELTEKDLTSALVYREIWVKTILKTDRYNGVPPCLQKIQLRYNSK